MKAAGGQKRARIAAAALGALSSLWTFACEDDIPVPHDLHIEPAIGSALLETPVMIRGEGLAAFVKTDFTHPQNSTVDLNVSVTLGEIELRDAQLVERGVIHAIVPAGMTLGVYTLRITLSTGQVAESTAAFTVRAPLCTDVPIGAAFQCSVCETISGCRCDGRRCIAYELDPPPPIICENCGEGQLQGRCGDGLITFTELCDDGGRAAGDGCSPVCTREVGFTCTGEPSVCTAICGDGLIRGAETCDDTRRDDGDGCSARCAQETGFTCSGEPTLCTTVCGDGLVRGAELCDDARTDDGDGCSSTCTIDLGYACSGEPSVCSDDCGDGELSGVETCDDGNYIAADGCSAACAVERGWTCPFPGLPCTPICGDGILVGEEPCDDGDTSSGDGCSDACTPEPGFDCSAGTSCTPICADGRVVFGEGCDDTNLDPGDGCSATCTVEQGFDCGPTGTICAPICGDGLLRGAESCDDGNGNSGDGCNDTCVPEVGFVCFTPGTACTAICGDALVRGSETCDDENAIAGDGCSATCTIEQGWICFIPGAACIPDCGDGMLVGAENCDDGNLNNNDGCSAACTPEQGYLCTTPGSPCAPICGDAMLVAAEGCDDGNLLPDDGCSNTCALEVGWACPTPGSACSAVCGDGYLRAAEACDDDNLDPGDGCTPTCTIEQGWTCATPGAACTAICGDGLQLGPEACDDDNLTDGDGCTATCTVEQGWICGTPAAPCSPICGDGLVRGSEACDDGDGLGGDGCSPSCTVEAGFSCAPSGTSCAAICGDGLVRAGERCDDGNLTVNDGCSATCTVEQGYDCNDGQPSVCVRRCSNRLRNSGEMCDDGNVLAGDGCDANCQVETGFICARFPSTCAGAATVAVVDDSGVCPGAGTLASPYCSITAALATTAATLYLRPGEYRENVTFTGRTLSIVADEGAMLMATSESAPAVRIEAGSDITLTGLSISNGASRVSVDAAEVLLRASQVGPGNTGAGVVSTGASEVRLEQTRVADNPGGGVNLGGTFGFRLTHSVFSGNGASGIRITATTGTSRIEHVTVADNTSAAGVAAGIRCDVANVPVVSSIVWGNRSAGSASAVSSGCAVTYSDLEVSASGTGNLSSDPQLVRPTYHYRGGSVAVNAGDPASTATFDYDGNPRPSGGRTDMGAYEATLFPIGRDPAESIAFDRHRLTDRYLDRFERGLYPGGSFIMPPVHKAAGFLAANAVVPRTTAGVPDAAGRYVFLMIGGSDAAELYCTESNNNPPARVANLPTCIERSYIGHLNRGLVEAIDRTQLWTVNGAYPNQFADDWTQDDDPFPPVPFVANIPTVYGNWDRVRDRVLTAYSLSPPTEQQVQAMFILLSNERPVASLPDRHADATQLMVRLGNILRIAKIRYPNLQLALITSRTYSGATTSRAPFEPFAYESAFAVKWLIEAQMAQVANARIMDQRAGNLDYSAGAAPWIAWGPWLWGHEPGSQSLGVRWYEGDFDPAAANGFFTDRGEVKGSMILLHGLTLSPFLKCWLMLHGSCS